MTMTDDQVRALLDGVTPGLADHCLYHCGKRVAECPCMRDLAAKHALASAAPDLARALLQARADAAAAQSLMVERVLVILENWLIGTDASDEIRAIAPDAGTAELRRLNARVAELEGALDVGNRAYQVSLQSQAADCSSRKNAEASLSALRTLLNRWQSYGCPDCGGDCASANPPVNCCIMQETRVALKETPAGLAALAAHESGDRK